MNALRLRFAFAVAVVAFVAVIVTGSMGGSETSGSANASPPLADSRLTIVRGFYANQIANVADARELAMLPNGDLLVGTEGRSIAIVPNADGPGLAGAPQTFLTLDESPAASIVYAPNGALYAATNTTIWRIPYVRGDRSESRATAIARVRTGPVAPNSDGDVHATTSVVATSTTLYAGVGSSCNACVEVDPTRAAVLRMNLDGSGMKTLATRTRNPIALAVNPATGSLWIAGAGQDDLIRGHPYEYFDSPASTTAGLSAKRIAWRTTRSRPIRRRTARARSRPPWNFPPIRR
jgi:glucose/arabinose dehydrogenase